LAASIERDKTKGIWTLFSVTDHAGNQTERGVRRAGAKVTLAGRPHVGLRYAYEYQDGSGVLTTSMITDFDYVEMPNCAPRLVITTVNSVYTFDKEAV